jgi:RNAse (barnase) inhibitor barstar
MSGLAEVLSGRAVPGAYRWESNRPLEEVRHTVEHAGWRFGHLEGARIETRLELHEAVSEALVLPDWYGRNLDALADVLRDVDGRMLLLWDTWSVLARAEPDYFAQVVELLGGAVVLLLRGDGPAVDVPVLD